MAAVGAAYFFAARLSLMIAIPPGYATPVWPPSGIALAVILMLGNRSWPAVWFGAAIANLGVESSFVSAILIATGNTLEAIAAATLMRLRDIDVGEFRRGDEVIEFVAFCAVSACVAATAALAALSSGHPLSTAESLRNWWTWWQGDLAGMIIVAPLIMSWSAVSEQARPWRKKLETIGFACLLLVSAVAMSSDDASQLVPFTLTFVSLPFIIWAAFRFGQRELTSTLAVVCGVAVWHTVERRGPLASVPLNELLLTLLTFVCIVVTTGLILLAIVRERSRAIAALRTRQMKLESELEERAHYDPVTGLANIALFDERLAELLNVTGKTNQNLAVVLMEIERFKDINDSLGRQAGDVLLGQIAERLKKRAKNATLLARAGGDRFAIAVYGFENERALARVVETRLGQLFGTPYQVGNSELRLSARIGLAMSPHDGHTSDDIYSRAESALKKAKATGESYLFYTETMSKRVASRLSLENKLRRAIEREEFVLHYQPKIRLDTRRIVGVEALIRWNSPDLGLVPPLDFIPLLEETGMILEVGRWALRRAALDQALWVSQGNQAPRIAVNVSSIQLRQRDFVETVQDAIAVAGSPASIDLEVTESRLMEDVDANVEKLARLRSLGVGIAIDDFGTGYSSLAYLIRLPVETLKIDRFFIDRMLADDQVMDLVQMIISLAQSLKLTTVAEGVETQEQVDVLELLLCDQIQGYWVNRPLPCEQIIALLEPGGAH